MDAEQEKVPQPCFKVTDDVFEYRVCAREHLKFLSRSSVL